MAHEGPKYGHIGEARTAGVDYIAGTETKDKLRNRDSSWNSGKGLFVKWTDGFDQKHVVRIHNKTDEVTVVFPVSGKGVNWYNGVNEKKDHTGFDALCQWVQVKFFYVESDWANNHGICAHLKGYSKIQCRDVDWERVKKGLEAGKDVAEIAAEIAAEVAAAAAV